MKFTILFFIGLLFLVGEPPAAAQDFGPRCAPNLVFSVARTLKPSGDAQQDMAALRRLGAMISTQSAACAGYTWQGTTSAEFPVQFPAGAYLIRFATDATRFAFAAFETGTTSAAYCTAALSWSQRYAVIQPEAACTATLKVTMPAGGPYTWEVSAEPVK